MDYKSYSMDFAGHKLTLEFGKYAQQAGGSVLVRYGETVVLVNATDEPQTGTLTWSGRRMAVTLRPSEVRMVRGARR